MKTLIFQSDNRSRDCDDYPKYSSDINQKYAQEFGYDYQYITVNPTWRHPSWLKLQVAIDLIQSTDYDRYMYLDTDCIVNNWISIDEYLKSASFIRKDKDAHISFLNDKPWSDVNPCAGFFIFDKNNLEMFKSWWDINLPEKNTVHPYEQAALHSQVDNFNMNIIDDWMFREVDGQYLRHIGSHESHLRLPVFKKFYENL